MDERVLKKQIKELRPWYQEIDFGNGVIAKSAHSKLSGEYAWKYIKQLLPKSLEGKRVLDIGSNGGLFSIRTAQMGARKVIGLEQEPKHLRQCAFLKDYFGTKNVRFINQDLNLLPSVDIGKFDYILAISVLYWVGRPGVVKKGTHYSKVYRDKEVKFIEHVTKLSDNFIVRARGTKYNSADYYGNIFNNFGFDCTKVINEGVGSHELMRFERRV